MPQAELLRYKWNMKLYNNILRTGRKIWVLQVRTHGFVALTEPFWQQLQAFTLYIHPFDQHHLVNWTAIVFVKMKSGAPWFILQTSTSCCNFLTSVVELRKQKVCISYVQKGRKCVVKAVPKPWPDSTYTHCLVQTFPCNYFWFYNSRQ